jgi:hypothetical protein
MNTFGTGQNFAHELCQVARASRITPREHLVEMIQYFQGTKGRPARLTLFIGLNTNRPASPDWRYIGARAYCIHCSFQPLNFTNHDGIGILLRVSRRVDLSARRSIFSIIIVCYRSTALA